MKILVFSDSHSCPNRILKAVNMHNGKCDLILFLGDGLKDLDIISTKYPEIPIIKVKGNCDYFASSDALNENILDLDGIKVLITHGHNYGVKYGYDTIIKYAFELEVDAVFFGHTHVPCDKIEYIDDKQIHLFNPGSVAMTSTYGVINTSNGVLVTNVAKIS
jgi:putative phosphoesterase